jgi:hypothetical protein
MSGVLCGTPGGRSEGRSVASHVGRRAGADDKGRGMKRRKVLTALCVAAVFAAVLGVASTAYGAYHHAGEIDSAHFLAVHPASAGTKLDSCGLCHTGGSVTSGGKTSSYGSCQFCHVKYGYDASGDILLTLNPYGAAYLAAGRSEAAVRAIENADSDGDGYRNVDEIAAVRFPGDATDDPSKVPAPFRVYTLKQLKALPAQTQFLLMNASKSTDDYTTYKGVTMANLLKSAGRLPSAVNIKVFAPDGFSVYHPLRPGTAIVPGEYPVYGFYPQGTFRYNAIADIALNPSGGWANYSDPGSVGRTDGSAIVNSGGLKLLLAYERAGAPLAPGVLNLSNKLDGEGPFRVVPPQMVPSVPDQRSNATSSTLIWPYDSGLDHNAGYSSRSATIIKVEPLPAGTTDINTMEAGWDYVDSSKIVVYGAIDPIPTAKAKLHALSALVSKLPARSFRGRAVVRRYLASRLTRLEKRLTKSQVKQTIHDIQKHLLPKVDGIPRPGHHRWDWIIKVDAQRSVYWGLREVVTLLKITK